MSKKDGKGVMKHHKFINDYLNKVELNERTALCTVILSVSDVCNLKCWCCPRGHGYVHPEWLPDFMSLDTVKLLCKQLGKDFCGRFSISGLGEPTLHKDLKTIIDIINEMCPESFIVLITNGANITNELIDTEYLKSIEISVYNENDFYFYSNKYKEFFPKIKVRGEYEGNMATPVNNRAGNVYDIFPEEVPDTVCYMPFYQVTVDTDGTIHHCSCDWKREDTAGNIYEQDIYDIYTNNFRNVREKQLNHDRKSLKLCSKCSGMGNIANEFKIFWKSYYESHPLEVKQ